MHFWHCKCCCDNKLDVSVHDLKTGNTTSCGCKQAETHEVINRFKEATRTEGVLVSALRSKLRADNKTGVKGVYFNKREKNMLLKLVIKIEKYTWVHTQNWTMLFLHAKKQKEYTLNLF